MKFIHIADVHLGASPDAGKAYSEKREAEIWDSFAGIIELCEEEQMDLLLIAGDLFHRQPLLRELKEVNYLFSKLTHTKVVLIAGNHDYIKPTSYYRSFGWNDNVFFLRGEEMQQLTLPELETCIYGFSYYAKEIPEARYDRAEARREQPIEILLAHGGDDRHIPLQKQSLSELKYDYIALGHIHKPQALIPDYAVYAGALEPIDKNDTGAHGYIRGEITKQGVKTKFVACAKREYIHLAVTVDDTMTGHALKETIRTEITRHGSQHIYKIRLIGFRDPEILFDPDGMDTYGNILEIIDETQPAYDFGKLLAQNEDNLLGSYIQSFADCENGSIEAQALYEGVQALLSTRRG